MPVDIKKYKFGVIGYGFLGTAVVHGFGLHADIKIYDKFKQFDPLEEVVEHSDFIWMCLPTPMDIDSGEIDLSILDNTLSEINNLAKSNSNKVVIIKSTVVPGTTRKFAEKYTNLKFIMNPEFLTARNNRLDFICASRIIIGAEDQEAAKKVEDMYRYRFGNSTPIFHSKWEEAELTKYGANCLFAVKISYFNFIYDLCQKLNIDFNYVRDMILADGRIGRSHANVPGWDNQRGYSGSCFPKDVNALINFAKIVGGNPELLEASWSQNLKDRPSRDWEKIPSAVTKGKKNV